VKEVLPHSAFKATDCPGDEIRSWIAAGMPVESEDSDMTSAEFLEAIRGEVFNSVVQKAVEEALQRRGASPHVFVTAKDERGIFVVTSLGLIHVDDPTIFSSMSGGKSLASTPIAVSPEWLTEHLALENL
jgi:hypothetical protein